MASFSNAWAQRASRPFNTQTRLLWRKPNLVSADRERASKKNSHTNKPKKGQSDFSRPVSTVERTAVFPVLSKGCQVNQHLISRLSQRVFRYKKQHFWWAFVNWTQHFTPHASQATLNGRQLPTATCLRFRAQQRSFKTSDNNGKPIIIRWELLFFHVWSLLNVHF